MSGYDSSFQLKTLLTRLPFHLDCATGPEKLHSWPKVTQQTFSNCQGPLKSVLLDSVWLVLDLRFP